MRTKKETKNKDSLSLTQEMLNCPICGKEFKLTEDSKYKFNGKHVCTWKCFLKEVRKRAVAKEDKKNKK